MFNWVYWFSDLRKEIHTRIDALNAEIQSIKNECTEHFVSQNFINQQILKRLEVLESKPFKVEVLKRSKPKKLIKKKQ